MMQDVAIDQRLAVIDRGLDLRANPAWCAVRELNPHLLGVGQLFWSVELPARKLWWRVQELNVSGRANLAPKWV